MLCPDYIDLECSDVDEEPTNGESSAVSSSSSSSAAVDETINVIVDDVIYDDIDPDDLMTITITPSNNEEHSVSEISTNTNTSITTVTSTTSSGLADFQYLSLKCEESLPPSPSVTTTTPSLSPQPQSPPSCYIEPDEIIDYEYDENEDKEEEEEEEDEVSDDESVCNSYDDDFDDTIKKKTLKSVVVCKTTTTPPPPPPQTASDEDEEDDINIILDQHVVENSVQCLKAAKQYNIDYDDIEINNEIDTLVKNSVNLRTHRVVTVLIRDVLVIIPIDCPISARLASLIWGTPVERETEYKKKNMELFNTIMPKIEADDKTVAFFTGVYQNHTKTAFINNKMKHAYRSKDFDTNSKNLNRSGVYVFYDFTLLIVRNGKIIDYAVHAYNGNVSRLIEKYNPSVIYYDGVKDNAFDIFMNYPYQPFYNALHKRMEAVNIAIDMGVNTISFCERRQTYCSFCKALKFIKSFYKPRKVIPSRVLQQKITIPAPMKRKYSEDDDRIKYRKHYPTGVYSSSSASSISSTTSSSNNYRKRSHCYVDNDSIEEYVNTSKRVKHPDYYSRSHHRYSSNALLPTPTAAVTDYTDYYYHHHHPTQQNTHYYDEDDTQYYYTPAYHHHHQYHSQYYQQQQQHNHNTSSHPTAYYYKPYTYHHYHQHHQQAGIEAYPIIDRNVIVLTPSKRALNIKHTNNTNEKDYYAKNNSSKESKEYIVTTKNDTTTAAVM